MSGRIDNRQPPAQELSWGDAFNALSGGYQALTIITVAIVTLFTFGIASVFVFRALVNAFSKLDLEGNKPHEKIARKVDEQAEVIKPGSNNTGKEQPDVIIPITTDADETSPTEQIINIPLPPETLLKSTFDPKTYLSSLGRKAKPSLGESSKFMRTYLSQELGKGNLKTLETKDDGDCFWDGIAQGLSILEGKPVTLKDVRMACYNYLKSLDTGDEKDNWAKIAIGDGLDETYSSYMENIQYTTDECLAKNIPSPVWGDSISAKIISRIYNVKIHSYTASMYEVEVEEELSDEIDDTATKSEFELAKDQQRIYRTFSKNVDEEFEDYHYEDDIEGNPQVVGSTKIITTKKSFAEVVELVDANDPDITDERADKSNTLRTLKIASYQSFPSGHVLLVVPSDF